MTSSGSPPIPALRSSSKHTDPSFGEQKSFCFSGVCVFGVEIPTFGQCCVTITVSKPAAHGGLNLRVQDFSFWYKNEGNSHINTHTEWALFFFFLLIFFFLRADQQKNVKPFPCRFGKACAGGVGGGVWVLFSDEIQDYLSFLFFFLKRLYSLMKKKKKKRFTNKITACINSPEERWYDNINPNITLFNSPIKHWKKRSQQYLH